MQEEGNYLKAAIKQDAEEKKKSEKEGGQDE